MVLYNIPVEKKKKIALVSTIASGIVLLILFVFLQTKEVSKGERSEQRASFQELYTTLVETTQQHFSRE